MFRNEISVLIARQRTALVLVFITAFLFGFLIRSCFPKEILLMHDDLTPEVLVINKGPLSIVQTEPVYKVDVVADIISSTNDNLDPSQTRVIANEIVYQMGVYGMDPEEDLPYILSLYYQESRFNPLARNPNSTARGVGQILMSLHGHKFDNYDDWMNPAENIAVSFQIINGGYDRNLEVGARWSRVFRKYSGGLVTPYTRHVDRFVQLLSRP